MKNKNYSKKQAIQGKIFSKKAKMFTLQTKGFNYLKNVQN